MTKKKTIAALAALASIAAAAALAGAGGCETSDLPTYLTDCTWTNPDAGANGDLYDCSVEWACSMGNEHFELDCNVSGGNFSCVCSTDTTSTTTPIAVNPFACNGTAALPPASTPTPGGCGWMIELASAQPQSVPR
jgi:hypothetical protein